MNSIHREKWVEKILPTSEPELLHLPPTSQIYTFCFYKDWIWKYSVYTIGYDKKNQIQTFLVSSHISANLPGTAILTSKLLCRCGTLNPKPKP